MRAVRAARPYQSCRDVASGRRFGLQRCAHHDCPSHSFPGSRPSVHRRSAARTRSVRVALSPLLPVVQQRPATSSRSWTVSRPMRHANRLNLQSLADVLPRSAFAIIRPSTFPRLSCAKSTVNRDRIALRAQPRSAFREEFPEHLYPIHGLLAFSRPRPPPPQIRRKPSRRRGVHSISGAAPPRRCDQRRRGQPAPSSASVRRSRSPPRGSGRGRSSTLRRCP